MREGLLPRDMLPQVRPGGPQRVSEGLFPRDMLPQVRPGGPHGGILITEAGTGNQSKL